MESDSEDLEEQFKIGALEKTKNEGIAKLVEKVAEDGLNSNQTKAVLSSIMQSGAHKSTIRMSRNVSQPITQTYVPLAQTYSPVTQTYVPVAQTLSPHTENISNLRMSMMGSKRLG